MVLSTFALTERKHSTTKKEAAGNEFGNFSE